VAKKSPRETIEKLDINNLNIVLVIVSLRLTKPTDIPGEQMGGKDV